MCGIAGIVALRERARAARPRAARAHGGRAPPPRARRVRRLPRRSAPGLAHARLSIIDLATGQQPLANEDGTLWIVFNGEIFNYVELRDGARGARPPLPHPQRHRGHRPRLRGVGRATPSSASTASGRSRCGTRRADEAGPVPRPARRAPAVLLRARRAAALRQRGQGASSPPTRRIPRALDPRGPRRRPSRSGRVGAAAARVFARRDGARARARADLRATARVARARLLDARAIPTTASGARSAARSTTPTRRVRDALERGHPRCACCAPTCRSAATSPAASTARSSPRSGCGAQGERLQTFSLRFEDAEYDETRFQRLMVEQLGSEHQRSGRQPRATSPRSSPTSSAHAERPILRTAPAPLFLLSRLVHDAGIKVVLTGEGADEMFAGYDLFREAQGAAVLGAPAGARRCGRGCSSGSIPTWRARRSRSRRWRGSSSAAIWTRWREPGFAHEPRWRTTAALKRLFAPDAARGHRRARRGGRAARRPCPPEFARWSSLAQDQYLEVRTLLVGLPALLAGRPDADGPLGRGALPVPRPRRHGAGRLAAGGYKLRGLDEKHVLKRAGARPGARRRSWSGRSSPTARPTRSRSSAPDAPDWVDETLSEAAIWRGPGSSTRAGRAQLWRSAAPGADERPALQRRQHGARRRPLDAAPARAVRRGGRRRESARPCFGTVATACRSDRRDPRCSRCSDGPRPCRCSTTTCTRPPRGCPDKVALVCRRPARHLRASSRRAPTRWPTRSCAAAWAAATASWSSATTRVETVGLLLGRAQGERRGVDRQPADQGRQARLPAQRLPRGGADHRRPPRPRCRRGGRSSSAHLRTVIVSGDRRREPHGPPAGRVDWDEALAGRAAQARAAGPPRHRHRPGRRSSTRRAPPAIPRASC